MMRKSIFLLMIFGFTSLAFGAQVITVWDRPDNIPALNQFYFNNKLNQKDLASIKPFFYTSKNQNRSNPYQFKAVRAQRTNLISHVRYQEYFKNIPVWGMQLIVHHQNHIKITGDLITGFEKDIPSTNTQLTQDDILQAVKDIFNKQYPLLNFANKSLLQTTLIIYLEHSDHAKLAYYVTFFIKDPLNKKLRKPVYIIDANTGDKLKYYDDIHADDIGSGPGGNDITGLTFRSTNQYQFGTALGGMPSLGHLPVTFDSGNCIMETPQIRLSSYHNVVGTTENFPILYSDEINYPVFSYACNSGSGFLNANDNGESPTSNNGFFSYSANNDTFYFAQMTYRMMQSLLPEVQYPWSSLLPVRVFTHVADFDNAIAISPVNNVDQSLLVDFNPQFVVGNGQVEFYVLNDAGTVAHELSHIVTNYASNLVYADQSGGVNEAYSDIAGQTFEFYLSQLFPWYGYSWEVSPSICLPSGPCGGKALRYMNNPPLDNESIANAAKYVPGMDVHFSSGVFNYAFYQMVALQGINFYKGYQYFTHANLGYWTPSSDFNYASCGVMQAAIDAGNKQDFRKIMQVFKNVGVKCKIGIAKLMLPA